MVRNRIFYSEIPQAFDVSVVPNYTVASTVVRNRIYSEIPQAFDYTVASRPETAFSIVRYHRHLTFLGSQIIQ